VEKFITNNIWKEVNNLISSNCIKKKKACIAYVTSSILNLNEGDILICDASESSIKNGNTSAKALKTYLSQGVENYSLEQLHSKFLLSEDYFVIGSSNLSENSAESLIESAVFTENKILISEASIFFIKLINISDKINHKKIEELLSIQINKKEEEQLKIISPKRNELINSTKNEEQEINIEIEKYSVNIINVPKISIYDGRECVVLLLSAGNQFLSKNVYKYIFEKGKINEWKEAIEKKIYPKIYCRYKFVQDLPQHFATKDEKKKTSTTLGIFIFCDSNGNLLEDSYDVAMSLLQLENYYTMV